HLLPYVIVAHTDPRPPLSDPLSLPDALPICSSHEHPSDSLLEPIVPTSQRPRQRDRGGRAGPPRPSRGYFALVGSIAVEREVPPDRKSTRLNSSHRTISYAVFCLKKKKTHII